jgi:RimK family alpha-L-glutamate ligase
MTLFVAADAPTSTNVALVAALERLGERTTVAGEAELQRGARPGDAVLGRLDVLPTLDGVSRCAWLLQRLERQGLRVLNRTAALLGAHDKLFTAVQLARAGIPHPHTAQVDDPAHAPGLNLPVVVKPRFGSWGRDVALCRTQAELRRHLRAVASRTWFARHGALVQECVRPRGYDLRVVVAGGVPVGAVERVAPPGEWRTNVALGSIRRPVERLPEPAARLAVEAAASLGGDLVGVDLLPVDGGWVVLEVNGAVDFTAEYALDGTDPFEAAAGRLIGVLRDDGYVLPAADALAPAAVA